MSQSIQSSLSRRSGGGATFLIAAHDAPAIVKARADYRCDGVDDHVQIQAAFDAFGLSGGKIVLSKGTFIVAATIEPSNDNWLFSGQGRGAVIKLKDSGNTTIFKTNDGIMNWYIKDITFDGNKVNQTDDTKPVIFIDNTSAGDMHSSLTRVKITNGKGVGLYTVWPRRIQLIDCTLNYNESHGAHQTKGHLEAIATFFTDNGGDGFHADNMEDARFVGCNLSHNEGQGINLVKISEIEGSVIYGNSSDGIGEVQLGSAIGCMIRHNEGSGIKKVQTGTVQGNTIAGNDKYGVGEYGINDSHIIGNIIRNNSYDNPNSYPNVYLSSRNTLTNNTIGQISGPTAKYAVRISTTGYKNVIKHNSIYPGQTSTFYSSGDGVERATIMDNALNDEHYPVQRIDYYKNGSGGNLVKGAVVILKSSVAAGNEFTTTTTAGDDKVLGMLGEDVSDNSFGDVMLAGKTSLLKVSGETDIAIGDFLCTHNAAGIAQKAAAGDMAFAVALEAYSANDHNGVIDAVLINPRKL